MTGSWPVGPEVRVDPVRGGAMLYDTSCVGNFTAEWFEPGWWLARGGRIDSVAGGRGGACYIEFGERQLMLRHYRRGGLIARLSRDRYVWRGEDATRSFAEWHLLHQLHQAGLPVPRPVAARYRRHGLSYSADLLMERIPRVRSLASLVRSWTLPRALWEDVGRCIERFHRAGCCHADLNAHNVLIDDLRQVWLVDFDRGRLRRPGMWCDDNLVRLLRSLRKITDPLPARHFRDDDWRLLIDAYFGARRQHPEHTPAVDTVFPF